MGRTPYIDLDPPPLDLGNMKKNILSRTMKEDRFSNRKHSSGCRFIVLMDDGFEPGNLNNDYVVKSGHEVQFELHDLDLFHPQANQMPHWVDFELLQELRNSQIAHPFAQIQIPVMETLQDQPIPIHVQNL